MDGWANMREKLDETERACNLIKSRRMWSRTHLKVKTVSIPLFEEEKCRVTAILNIFCNIFSGNVSFAHGLRCKKENAYPSKFYKLNCYTERAIGLLYLKRGYYKKHKEEISKKAGEYYQNNKEELIAKAREYRLEHKKERSEKAGEYYQKNKEKIAKQQREYREKKREYVKDKKL